MKRKLLKYKGIPISPIVLFKTILNDKKEALDKVLENLENRLISLIQCEVNKLKTETTNSLKLYDACYRDGNFYFNTTKTKEFNFKNAKLKNVRFESIPPINLNKREDLKFIPIKNMGGYVFVNNKTDQSIYPHILETETNNKIIIFEDNSIILNTLPNSVATHSFHLYGDTTNSKPDYCLKIIF